MNIILNNQESDALANIILTSEKNFQLAQGKHFPKLSFNLLQPLRQGLDEIEIPNAEIARFLSSVIPAQCPFERDIATARKLRTTINSQSTLLKASNADLS